MKGIQIHLCSGAKGKTSSFGKIAIVQFDGSSFPGTQIRTKGEACSTGCALTPIKDFAFQSLKTFVHGLFSVNERWEPCDEIEKTGRLGGDKIVGEYAGAAWKRLTP